MRDASKEATVLLYSPGIDSFLEDLTRNADRDSHLSQDQGQSQDLGASDGQRDSGGDL